MRVGRASLARHLGEGRVGQLLLVPDCIFHGPGHKGLQFLTNLGLRVHVVNELLNRLLVHAVDVGAADNQSLQRAHRLFRLGIGQFGDDLPDVTVGLLARHARQGNDLLVDLQIPAFLFSYLLQAGADLVPASRVGGSRIRVGLLQPLPQVLLQILPGDHASVIRFSHLQNVANCRHRMVPAGGFLKLATGDPGAPHDHNQHDG